MGLGVFAKREANGLDNRDGGVGDDLVPGRGGSGGFTKFRRGGTGSVDVCDNKVNFGSTVEADSDVGKGGSDNKTDDRFEGDNRSL